MAVLGRGDAVAQFGRAHLSGLAGWLAGWGCTSPGSTGLQSKVTVLLNWISGFVLANRPVRSTTKTASPRRASSCHQTGRRRPSLRCSTSAAFNTQTCLTPETIGRRRAHPGCGLAVGPATSQWLDTDQRDVTHAASLVHDCRLKVAGIASGGWMHRGLGRRMSTARHRRNPAGGAVGARCERWPFGPSSPRSPTPVRSCCCTRRCVPRPAS